MKNIGLILIATLLIYGCKSDEKPTEVATEFDLTLNFKTVIDQNVVDSETTYINSAGESYTVNELKYILSNIQFIKADGSSYAYPVEDSYFLVNAFEAETQIAALVDIPLGEYTEIKFGFGVDPTQYPIESGTLNFIPRAEEAGMLWSWSAGYKFIKLEGMYGTQGAPVTSDFLIHVGSHGANLDNYKEITLAFPTNRTSPVEPRQLTITFDASQVFDGANPIRIEDKTDIQVDPINAPKIAQNIQAAFTIN